jgi:hypothetical protein
MFVESSRIYRLARTNPTYDATFAALRAAAGTETPVFVRFDKANSDWIERVASP